MLCNSLILSELYKIFFFNADILHSEYWHEGDRNGKQ